MNFSNPVVIDKIEIKFQGGFCSSHAKLEAYIPDEKSFVNVFEFYPEDINSTQVTKNQAIAYFIFNIIILFFLLELCNKANKSTKRLLPYSF